MRRAASLARADGEVSVEVAEIAVAHRAGVEHQHVPAAQRLIAGGRDHVAVAVGPRPAGHVGHPVGPLLEQRDLEGAEDLRQWPSLGRELGHAGEGAIGDAAGCPDPVDLGLGFHLAHASYNGGRIREAARRKALCRKRVIGKRHPQLRLGAHGQADAAALGTQPASASTSRPTPSSRGSGASHVRMSLTQVRPMRSAPMAGITAMGGPAAGTITNQGRVGLSQNRVRKPVT